MKNAAISITLLAGACVAHAGTVAETTWDSGTLEGWTYPDTGGGDWTAPTTGGNGGGFAQYIDGVDGSAPVPQLFAPSAFLGDYTGYIGGYIEYDIILNAVPGPGEPTNYPRIRLVGSDGSEARVIADYLLTDSWQNVHVNIVESEWEMVSGTWAGLIGDVSELHFGGDFLVGSGPEAGVDNFRLVPATPFATLMTLGMAGMIRRRR